MAVTNVTFRHFGGPRDAWLPNWIKWYSIITNNTVLLITYCILPDSIPDHSGLNSGVAPFRRNKWCPKWQFWQAKFQFRRNLWGRVKTSSTEPLKMPDECTTLLNPSPFVTYDMHHMSRICSEQSFNFGMYGTAVPHYGSWHLPKHDMKWNCAGMEWSLKFWHVRHRRHNCRTVAAPCDNRQWKCRSLN
jgi:hypothetical protein